MKKLIALMTTLMLVLALFAGCGSGTDDSAASERTAPVEETAEAAESAETDSSAEEAAPAFYSYALGDTVADFSVELCDGSVFTLSEALETHDVVMINIWATWCEPCRLEFPVMDEAYAEYSDRVALVALSPFDDNEAVAEYREENGLSLPMGADTVGAGDLVYEGYPTTVIIDRFGTYVYYECGSILDVDGFTRMWDYFLSDDYTESEPVYEIPGPKYEGELPSSEALTAAASNGSVTLFFDTSDEYAWPFLPAEFGLSNSNALQANTYAVISAEVTASAGDVFAFDYSADFETLYDEIDLYVDGEPVKTVLGSGEGTAAYTFTADGEYFIEISYLQNTSEYETETTGVVSISGIGLYTGAEAEALLASLPVYPYALEGDDFRLEVLSESARRIVVDDPNGTFASVYGDIELYIIPEETARFRILLGDSYNAETAYGYGDYDYIPWLCSSCETDETGYLFECELSSVELGGYCDTYVTLCPDAYDYYTYATFYIFTSEENVNYFLAYDATDENYDLIDGIYWTYEDGSLPSTDEIAREPGDYLYNIILEDENGEAVDGVMINICTDETCTPTMTSNGYYGFDGDEFAYVIHVLTVPEGYSFDTTQEFVLNAEGDVLVITIPHA